MLNELKKQKQLCCNIIARDLWLAGKNYNREFPKIVTCPKLKLSLKLLLKVSNSKINLKP